MRSFLILLTFLLATLPAGLALAEDLTHDQIIERDARAEALTDEAVALMTGKGADRDPVAAIAKFREAAELTSGRAMFHLAHAHYQGLGVEKDLDQAKEWLFKSSVRHYAPALILLGNLHEIGGWDYPKDPELAYQFMYRAANTGNAEAMRRVGNFYGAGVGVIANPRVEFRWYEKAAALGDGYAMMAMAAMCYNGYGTYKNRLKAREWFGRAAQKGETYSMRRLANMSFRGIECEQSLLDGIDWLVMAARAGDPQAARILTGAGLEWKSWERPTEPPANAEDLLALLTRETHPPLVRSR